MFEAACPALLVNAAAWTGVDTAEAEPDAAGRANRDGPATLAALCADAGIPMIHVSTDYVFDGLKGAPYTEADPTSPTGVYGRTKLEGEQAVLAACPRAVVLRTSWVYSAAGKNFVRTMLGAAQRVPKLRVVADQRGCPTSARDLARAILAIAPQLAAPYRMTEPRSGPEQGFQTCRGLPRRIRRLPRLRRRGHDLARPGGGGVPGRGPATATPCRRWRPSPPRTGRPRPAARRTAGWTAASWPRRSASGCRSGAAGLARTVDELLATPAAFLTGRVGAA